MNTENIRVLIVEDEAIVAMDLAAGLESEGYEVAGIADNAEDALQLFREEEVDILLMDISIIGERDGISVAGEMMEQRAIPLIYLTALTDAETISRAKHTRPSAFLTKPYTLTNVRIAMEMAMHNFAASQEPGGKVIPLQPEKKETESVDTGKETILQLKDYIFVKHNYAFVKVRLSDIRYIEADNNYIHLVIPGNRMLLRLSMNQLLEKINYPRLVRIHRSFAVNMEHITAFTDYEVRLDQQELPIGRSYKEDFLRNFNSR